MTDPMRDIERAKAKELKAQQEYEKILALARELYRLQGIPVYEPLDHEWDKLLKGE